MPVLQLGYHVVELCLLTGDGGEGELSFGLGEPVVGPERRKAHRRPVDMSSLGAVRSLLNDHVGVTNAGYRMLSPINYTAPQQLTGFNFVVWLYSELQS